MKAVLQYRASPGFREQIEKTAPAWLKISTVEERDTIRFGREMRDAHVLLHVLEPVTAEVIAAAPCLRLIQKIGVGVDTIDLESAKAGNIAVANMPGTNSQAAVELTIALMLATLRKLVPLDRATRSGGGWRVEPSLFDQSGELSGRVVGLVGFGRIAALLAPVLIAFGATVIATRPTWRQGDGRGRKIAGAVIERGRHGLAACAVDGANQEHDRCPGAGPNES